MAQKDLSNNDVNSKAGRNFFNFFWPISN